MASTITELSHLQIPLEDVVHATNNFADKNIISRGGPGGFGNVYKGRLLRSRKLMDISARRLDRRYGLGDVAFWTEISMLSDLKHENVVSIIGFCDEKDEKIIINTYEANGSLEEHLNNQNLTWMQRLKICVGVARALSYLQYDEGRSYGVIHRNINRCTILLDENWEAKLSGFEISLKQSINRSDQVLLSEAIGTIGYMDPAIENTGGVTHKSDIYSFGVVLFEILCGRKAFVPNDANRFLAPLAKFHFEKNTLYDIILPDLWKQMDPDSRNKFSKAAYSCLKEQARRPNMGQVVAELERALELHLHRGKSLEHLKIPLSDIKLTTNNFSKTYEISREVEYLALYRAELDHFDKENPSSLNRKINGELPKRRNTVVIKLFLDGIDTNKEERFLTELKLLTTCKHHNIVTLLGYCDEGSEMILVIEQLSNGYLGNCLANINVMSILTWEKRLKICLDVAFGLNYLHSEMLINRDIRSDYIALDENWRAKIVDFGLSVFMPPNQDGDTLFHDRQTIKGTKTYIDPEYHKTGKLKKESDVYGFGVVLFEILCGRRAYDPLYLKESDKGLVHVARRCMYEGKLNEMIDPIIKNETGKNNLGLNRGPNKDSLDTFIKIAYECVAETQDQRPTMEVVIKELEKASLFEEKKSQSLDQVVYELEKPSTLYLANENPEEQGVNEYLNQHVIESKKTLEHQLTRENLRKNLEHLRIPLSHIKLATHDFSSTHLVLEIEGCYNLYTGELDHLDKENPCSIEGMNKGELSKRRDTVTIKRFLPTEDNKGEEWFSTEFEMLTTMLPTCKHQNVVTLLGFCDEGSEMIIVIEYLSRRYLYDYLENINKMHILTWAKRLQICLDVANGLNYLHSEMIIHCDLNSDYIVLDENWRAKIVDFTESVLLPPNQDGDALLYDPQGILGRIQYTDPEFFSTGRLKRESDVYSFGVLLFEVLCGRLAYDPIYLRESDKGLVHVAQGCFSKGTLSEIIDPRINKDPGEKHFVLNRGVNKDSLDTFIKIAYECVAETQDQRPAMKDVIKELEKAITFQRKNLEHLRIPLSDIKLATHDFSETHLVLDVIGFYKLYKAKLDLLDKENPSSIERMNKGELPKRRDTVAIKRFLPREDKRGEERFSTEIEMLTTYKHRNIVTLLGFCDEGSEMILVVEYLSRGYLCDYLSKINDMPILTWAKRLQICLDVANGLNYLHSQMIIHCELRSLYIVLDENWRAKIADFTESVLLPPNQNGDALLYDRQGIFGTIQYTDPEYFSTGRLKRESDVYSFGVVLFEILCGRIAYDPIYLWESDKGLVHVAQGCFSKGTLSEIIDPRISEDYDEKHFVLNRGINKDSLDTFIKIAYECIAETQDQRPGMKDVIKELERAITFQENYKNYFKISLEDIKLATENFHPHNCIGRGGFGKVFIGKLPKDDGFYTVVAKQLDTSGGQGEQQFLSELQILCEYKHENVIRLLGYCNEKDDKIIVYEYASRGSLDNYLKDHRLVWMVRLKICVDVATALDFLHGGAGAQAKVIHRDIKTANILLDDDWKAKLADFGLSLISAINQETDYVIDHACGTQGYLDPLYRKSSFLTIESDIYSFGVVLFEILCGRSTYDVRKREGRFLQDFVKHMFKEGKHDEVAFKAIKEQIKPESLTIFQRIAFQCLEDDREKRPTAKEVLAQLKMAVKFQED